MNEFELLQQRVSALENQITLINNLKDRFSDKEVFKKAVIIKSQDGTRAGRLILEELTADPSDGIEGEIAYINGKLKVCTVGGTSPTWTIIGTQS